MNRVQMWLMLSIQLGCHAEVSKGLFCGACWPLLVDYSYYDYNVIITTITIVIITVMIIIQAGFV